MDTKENKIINKEECIQLISRWFLSDTVEFLDLVLKDDTVDPTYSAITALNRLYIYNIKGKKMEPFSVKMYHLSCQRWGILKRILFCLEIKSEKKKMFIGLTYMIQNSFKEIS